ncbi:hypothetical protein [Methyloversatilis sp.]|uniref:hypothetical protein n=1 Tax=Methyloversatilis sp. TaxID=2569862 RepID=UPI0035B00A40
MEYDLHNEIASKCLNCIEAVNRDYTQHRITDGEYSYASKLLWNAFSGLVGRDLQEIMTYLPEPRRNAAAGLKSVLIRESTLAIVTNDFAGKVTLFHKDMVTGEVKSKVYDVSDREIPTVDAFDCYTALINVYKRANFKELE